MRCDIRVGSPILDGDILLACASSQRQRTYVNPPPAPKYCPTMVLPTDLSKQRGRSWRARSNGGEAHTMCIASMTQDRFTFVVLAHSPMLGRIDAVQLA
eukprot:scaffold74370_cov18-Tisochrysis_lutea.AAC.2